MKIAYLVTSQQTLDGHLLLIETLLGAHESKNIFLVDLRIDKVEVLDLAKFPNNLQLIDEATYKNEILNSRHSQIYSVPYLEHYSLPQIINAVSKKIYCGYAPIWSSDPRLHFELEFYRLMDVILSTSNNADEGFIKSGVSPNSIVKVIDPNVRSSKRNDLLKSQLLWTPHWTQTWYGYPTGYSNFVWATNKVLEYTLDNPEVDLVLRPHPFLYKVIDSYKQGGLIDESPYGLAIAAWEKLLTLPNVFKSQNLLQDDITNSSAIVSDPSTVMVYAALAGKNAVTCYTTESPPLSSLGANAMRSSPVVPNSLELGDWLSDPAAAGSKTKAMLENWNALVHRMTHDRKEISEVTHKFV